jgi:hypothetical protein
LARLDGDSPPVISVQIFKKFPKVIAGARGAALTSSRSERLPGLGAVHLVTQGLVGFYEERLVRTIVKLLQVRRSSLPKGAAPYLLVAGGGQRLPEQLEVVLIMAPAELVYRLEG